MTGWQQCSTREGWLAGQGRGLLSRLCAPPIAAVGVDGGAPDRVYRSGVEAALLLVAGYGGQQDREAPRQAGFDAHLTKPVEMRELEALPRAGSSSSGAAIFDFPRRRA
jgi:CheY-like chemotaxis protein